jgi:hypothetical protein
MKTFHKPIPMLSLLALLLVVVWGCRKEKPAFDLSDKDPCSCASEVSADFVIEELAATIPETVWVETDTVFQGASVRFRAKEDNANYKWYIGSQVFNTRSVVRNFGWEWYGIDIPITLVVTKEPNSVCFPSDDGYDSIVKNFHIFEAEQALSEDQTEWSNWPTTGTYRMISPEHQDSFDMKIRVFRGIPNWENKFVTLENWDGSGNDCISTTKGLWGSSYRYIGFKQSGSTICTSLTGHLTRDINGSSVLQMRSLIINNQYEVEEKHYQYKGRKLS